MYRYLSIAAVVLSAAFSGPALAEGINSFSQANAAAVKVHADAPDMVGGIFAKRDVRMAGQWFRMINAGDTHS